MNYSELHYILCIAKHQNLTRAAQELYISQPTLTKHLQKLEREMGAKRMVFVPFSIIASATADSTIFLLPFPDAHHRSPRILLWKVTQYHG